MIQISLCRRRAAALQRLTSVFFIVAVALCMFTLSRAEDSGGPSKWVAPAAQAQKTNPVAANAASIDAGRKVYAQRCAKCHGEKGEGDGADAKELNLHPAKFTDSSVRQESDLSLIHI